MAILPILYWLILVLSVIFSFVPLGHGYINSLATLALFVILGLKVFRMSL